MRTEHSSTSAPPALLRPAPSTPPPSSAQPAIVDWCLIGGSSHIFTCQTSPARHRQSIIIGSTAVLGLSIGCIRACLITTHISQGVVPPPAIWALIPLNTYGGGYIAQYESPASKDGGVIAFRQNITVSGKVDRLGKEVGQAQIDKMTHASKARERDFMDHWEHRKKLPRRQTLAGSHGCPDPTASRSFHVGVDLQVHQRRCQNQPTELQLTLLIELNCQPMKAWEAEGWCCSRDREFQVDEFYWPDGVSSRWGAGRDPFPLHKHKGVDPLSRGGKVEGANIEVHSHGKRSNLSHYDNGNAPEPDRQGRKSTQKSEKDRTIAALAKDSCDVEGHPESVMTVDYIPE
ncbi:hypothetical protein B0H17DRAFT_1136934 [Mycena rosella]|uniref:Uncharacterized protein n=1 Tax=Mycena rosella TaxID=1033263 RepID=A0AAD7GBD4_MYCRO|nr:hypothetical protein B0H17DRAFT_1136934 [Mycena rosella]